MLLKGLLIILLFLGSSMGLAQTASQDVSVPAATAAPETAQPKAADVITLEPNVVQIVLNDEHRNGVDWGAIVSDYNTAPLTKKNDPMWDDKRYRVSFGTLSQDDYNVLLDALDMAGAVSQFPQPSVKVIAGTPSSISFDKQNIQVGLLLARLKSGDLYLHVSPSLTVPATEIWSGGKTEASIQLGAQTKVAVANDTIIVVGGFIKEEVIKRTYKFPLLGNIPIVGLVFRSRGHLMQKTETVIFLTMRTKAVEAPVDEDQ